jgi:hypothetical protein
VPLFDDVDFDTVGTDNDGDDDDDTNDGCDTDGLLVPLLSLTADDIIGDGAVTIVERMVANGQSRCR